MKYFKLYICFILFSIFIQNSYILLAFAGVYIGTKSSITLLLKKSENCKSEEDNEDNEEETKEENELNQYDTIYSIQYLTLKSLSVLNNSADSEIFTQYFETETPPPKLIV